MAERRMFAKTVIDSDLFLDMPLSTQALYFHLSMRADDDGFVNNPKKISRMIGAGEDSLKLLITKQFILPFESGVIVIKHWKVHNYIRKDTYNSTAYIEEKGMLTQKSNGEYELCHDSVTTPSQFRDEPVDESSTQVRLGKVSIGKVSIDDKPKRFTPPTFDEVKAYCIERKNNVDAQRFIDYYTANGWKVGRNSMKDWKATVRTWEKNQYSAKPKEETKETSYDLDEWEKIAKGMF